MGLARLVGTREPRPSPRRPDHLRVLARGGREGDDDMNPVALFILLVAWGVCGYTIGNRVEHERASRAIRRRLQRCEYLSDKELELEALLAELERKPA